MTGKQDIAAFLDAPGLDCLISGLDCLISGLDCLTSGLDCLICVSGLDCLKYSQEERDGKEIELTTLHLALTVLLVPESGLDCLICAIISP